MREHQGKNLFFRTYSDIGGQLPKYQVEELCQSWCFVYWHQLIQQGNFVRREPEVSEADLQSQPVMRCSLRYQQLLQGLIFQLQIPELNQIAEKQIQQFCFLSFC